MTATGTEGAMIAQNKGWGIAHVDTVEDAEGWGRQMGRLSFAVAPGANLWDGIIETIRDWITAAPAAVNAIGQDMTLEDCVGYIPDEVWARHGLEPVPTVGETVGLVERYEPVIRVKGDPPEFLGLNDLGGYQQ